MAHRKVVHKALKNVDKMISFAAALKKLQYDIIARPELLKLNDDVWIGEKEFRTWTSQALYKHSKARAI